MGHCRGPGRRRRGDAGRARDHRLRGAERRVRREGGEVRGGLEPHGAGSGVVIAPRGIDCGVGDAGDGRHGGGVHALAQGGDGCRAYGDGVGLGERGVGERDAAHVGDVRRSLGQRDAERGDGGRRGSGGCEHGDGDGDGFFGLGLHGEWNLRMGSADVVVAENATSVATLSATDADTAAADLSWSIPAGAAGGADAAQFALTADGVLSFRAAKDYEAPDDADTDGEYEVTVRVTDGANPVDAALVVRLSDVDDVDDVAPVLSSASVDGAVLTLTFGEALDADSVAPESSFAVTVGGSTRAVDAVAVSGSAVSGSAVTLTLSAAVETGDTVTVDYTVPTGESANKLQDASGNTAESFSGQAVTNNTSSSATPRTVPTPAPGAPNSLKVARHESGKLLASWNAPDSGPAPTGYTVQWKESADDWDDADDVSVANVKGTSHVITGLTDGVEYAVRVVARKGDAAGDPSGEVTATPQETVAPSPSAATVDGATLTITFDEPLDAGETPENSAFAVTVAGSSRGVDTVTVSGSAVTLTLASAVAAGETVTVDYTVPTGQSTNKLQDTSGNAAASFSGQAATNNTQAADPLTASVSAVPGSQSGEFTFELRFSETPRKKFSYKIMRDHAFTVTGGQVTKARRLVPRSNVGWEIHVQPDGDGDGTVTIVLPATTDCTAEGAICTQDGRKLSNRLEITVQGPAG